MIGELIVDAVAACARIGAETIVQGVVDAVGCSTAKIALLIITFGRAHARPLSAKLSGSSQSESSFARLPNGRIEVSGEAASIIGMLVCTFVIALVAFVVVLRT